MELDVWLARLEAAKGSRGEIIGELCRVTGWSRDTVYRRLKAAGWESGRKRRSDLGTSSLSEDELMKAGALLAQAQRKDGRNPMSVRRACGILRDNGLCQSIGESQLARLLRDYGLDKASLKRGEPHVSLRSLYPNHCHLVDPSLALWYFTPQGEQRVVHVEEHYKNKDYFQGRKIENKCWRYVLTDHYSGSICVRYYQAAGENIYNLWDFLLYAWGGKDTEPLYAFCGVPELMIWDKGSANQSRAIKRALESLGVAHWAHKAGAPRAKGSVETMNRHWEGWLETVLRVEPVHSVAELNEVAAKYCAALNADAFENHDSKLTRMGRVVGVRLHLWQEIRELRLLPGDRACRSLLTEEPVKKKVSNNLLLSFKGYVVKEMRYYNLSGLPGIEGGKEVTVQPLLYSGNDSVRVSWYLARHQGGEQMVYELEPVAVDGAGRPMTAAIIGEEFKAHKKSEQQVRREAASRTEVLEGLKTRSVVKYKRDLPAVIDIPGSPIELPADSLAVVGGASNLPIRAEVVDGSGLRYSVAESIARVRSELGDLPEGLSVYLRRNYANGLTVWDLEYEIQNYSENYSENYEDKKEAI